MLGCPKDAPGRYGSATADACGRGTWAVFAVAGGGLLLSVALIARGGGA